MDKDKWSNSKCQSSMEVCIRTYGEIYTIVMQQTAHNDIASSVYKSIDNGNSWILEGTNREEIISKT